VDGDAERPLPAGVGCANEIQTESIDLECGDGSATGVSGEGERAILAQDHRSLRLEWVENSPGTPAMSRNRPLKG
jgi:hypothetical protein